MECAARILRQVEQLPASCANRPEPASNFCRRKQLAHLYVIAHLAALRARGSCVTWESEVQSKLACGEHEATLVCLRRSLARSADAAKAYLRANRSAVEGVLNDDKRRDGSAMRDVHVAAIVDSALATVPLSPARFVKLYPDTLEHARHYVNGDAAAIDYELLKLCHDYFRETVPEYAGWRACARYYVDRSGEPIAALQEYFRACLAAATAAREPLTGP